MSSSETSEKKEIPTSGLPDPKEDKKEEDLGIGNIDLVPDFPNSLNALVIAYTFPSFRVTSESLCAGNINQVFPDRREGKGRTTHEAKNGVWIMATTEDCSLIFHASLLGTAASFLTQEREEIRQNRHIPSYCQEYPFTGGLSPQVILIDSSVHWGNVPLIHRREDSVEFFEGGVTFTNDIEYRGKFLSDSAFLWFNFEEFTKDLEDSEEELLILEKVPNKNYYIGKIGGFPRWAIVSLANRHWCFAAVDQDNSLRPLTEEDKTEVSAEGLEFFGEERARMMIEELG